MEIVILVVFILGYLAIAFEHSLKVNKTASALITGVVCWTLFMFSGPSVTLLNSEHYVHFSQAIETTSSSFSAEAIFRQYVSQELGNHLSAIAGVLFPAGCHDNRRTD